MDSFRGKTLIGADFSGQDLCGADFSNANLENADFSGTALARACFEGANLKNATFRHAKGKGAKREEYLIGPHFNQANLEGCDFRHAVLDGSEFKGSNLRHATFAFAGMSLSTWIGADLSHTDLRFAIVQESNFDQVIARNMQAYHVCAWDCSFNEADLQGSCLKGGEFSGCEMVNTNLNAANIDGASFYYENLINAIIDESTSMWLTRIYHQEFFPEQNDWLARGVLLRGSNGSGMLPAHRFQFTKRSDAYFYPYG